MWTKLLDNFQKSLIVTDHQRASEVLSCIQLAHKQLDTFALFR